MRGEESGGGEKEGEEEEEGGKINRKLITWEMKQSKKPNERPVSATATSHRSEGPHCGVLTFVLVRVTIDVTKSKAGRKGSIWPMPPLP